MGLEGFTAVKDPFGQYRYVRNDWAQGGTPYGKTIDLGGGKQWAIGGPGTGAGDWGSGDFANTYTSGNGVGVLGSGTTTTTSGGRGSGGGGGGVSSDLNDVFNKYRNNLTAFNPYKPMERIAPEGFDRFEDALKTKLTTPLYEARDDELDRLSGEFAKMGIADDPSRMVLTSKNVTQPFMNDLTEANATATAQRYGLEQAEKSDVNKLETLRNDSFTSFNQWRENEARLRAAVQINKVLAESGLDLQRELGLGQLWSSLLSGSNTSSSGGSSFGVQLPVNVSMGI